MKKPTIYLGGNIGNWKNIVRKKLRKKAELYDPFIKSRQNAIIQYTNDDLEAVKNSDLVLFYIDYEKCLGACIEAGYAYALEIPIITIFKIRKLPEMLCGISKYIFTDLETALNFIEEYYL